MTLNGRNYPYLTYHLEYYWTMIYSLRTVRVLLKQVKVQVNLT
jgi:hypothetical protein